MKVSFPGIGGSLGECVVCGKCFAREILLGENVAYGKLDGMDRDVPMHTLCADTLQAISDSDKDWRRLPEGPLRAEFKLATGSGT